MKKTGRWSSAEDEILIRCYRKVPSPRIAEMLGRPVANVQSRAKRIGLALKKRGTPRDRLKEIERSLEPLREQFVVLVEAASQYDRCALWLSGAEAEALARAFLGGDSQCV